MCMKLTRSMPMLAGLSCFVAGALTPVLSAEAPAPAEIIVLKAAHVFDATGTTLKDSATVVVRGDRIVSVGTGAAPPGARVIDLGDATLLPGFIDAHTHLTDELQKDYYHHVYNQVMRFPAEQALYAALYAKRTLGAGFTTVRNVGANDFVDIGVRNAINAGVTEGPRMLTAGHIIGSPGGHADGYSFPPERLPPLAPIAAKARAAAAAHGAMFKNALRVGVPIAFGTDAGVYPHGMNATEFGLMVDLGMSPAAALLAGTHESARLLGVEKEVGTLEPGKAADIVAVRGNVLSDIHATEHPVFVMRLGHIVAQKTGT